MDKRSIVKHKIYLIESVRLILVISLLVFSLFGCSRANTDEESTKKTTAESSDKAITQISGEEVKKETMDSLYSKVLNNDTGKTVIRRIGPDYTFNEPYAIISEEGTVIITDPYKLRKGLKADVVTITHTHSDHIDKRFLSANEGKESVAKVESFTVNDVSVKSIPSSHNGNDNIDNENPNNVIYIYELDGLRIAHFGDCGQDQLNEEQLREIGEIDVAFMIFLEWEDTNNTIEKSYKLMEQVRPKIVISHEYSEDGLEKIKEVVGNYEEVEGQLVISKEDLENADWKVVKINSPFDF